MSAPSAVPGLLPTPDLSDEKIVRFVAGLRPCRHGGLRLEAERVEAGGRAKRVVHNYGQGGCGITIAPGCAHAAADLVREAMGAEAGPVAVLGGGVVGLMTARELLSRGHEVTVYAERFVEGTTSALAGALWLPTGIEFGATPGEVARFREILGRSAEAFGAWEGSGWGVERLPVYEPAWASVEQYVAIGGIERPREIERLPFAGVECAGRVAESLFVHTPRFLRTLRDDVARRGGTLVERRFGSSDELASLDEAVAVNCLALSSRELFGDGAVYAARGMLVHMQAQRLGYIVHDDYWYMFPREDVLVLGGTFEADVWDATPSEEMAQQILARHRAFFGLA